MSEAIIRFVQISDAEDILRIYEPYVKDTAITFEYQVPSLATFKERITAISTAYPYLVCLIEGKIVGYAYAYKQMERAAYQWNAELSIYLDKPYYHRGIGKALYGCLIEILKLQNIQNIYGVVSSPNLNSEKLHEYLGFRKCNVLHNTGYKLGAWRDVTWYEKSINSHGLEPDPFLPIDQIDSGKLTAILNQYAAAIKA